MRSSESGAMSVRSAITVSLVPEAQGGPFVFWDDLPAAFATAADLGYDAIELFPPSASDTDTALLRQLLDRHALKLAAIGTGAGWVKHRLMLTFSDVNSRKRAASFVREIIDLAGEFGAPTIIGSMQGRFGDVAAGQFADRVSALELLRDTLAMLGGHASQYRQTLLFEPLNRYETNLVNTLGDAQQLLPQNSSVRLLADLFHMNIEEVDISAAIRAAGSHLGHLHFVDSNRRAAGYGHLDYAPIVAALREIGYNGYASAEALPWPDSHTAAKQTITAFRRWFQAES
jgi:sugar phosphate isomerase/epimerase